MHPHQSGTTANPAANAKGQVCWPLNFAGLTVGVNDDSHVRRLLGAGVFRADEGHTGGRYFIDEKQVATLHVVEGVDNVVEELTLMEGVAPNIKAVDRKAAITKWFNPHEQFGKWHQLHLGSTKDEVLSNLGQPQKQISQNKWEYESTCACELAAYLDLSFKAGRLVQVAISEEE
ncbi:MAG TPA: hypothetical protein VJR04_06910 [Terriglobales bacterium]|nr:hypothetical protein [Terriglobales bacterium]